jgi:hypothetical protein
MLTIGRWPTLIRFLLQYNALKEQYVDLPFTASTRLTGRGWRSLFPPLAMDDTQDYGHHSVSVLCVVDWWASIYKMWCIQYTQFACMANRIWCYLSHLIPAKISVNVWARVIDDYIVRLYVTHDHLGGAHADFSQEMLPLLWEDVPLHVCKSAWFHHDCISPFCTLGV